MLADMESTACPLNLTLKVEEEEEEIRSRDLEDGPTDMQKVRISEGGWVSEKPWGPHTAVGAGLAARPCGRPSPGHTEEVRLAQPRPVFAFLRKQCCGFKRL